MNDLGDAVDGVGGTRSTAASSVAMQAGGCVSIHMSKDACATFENSRDNLKMKLFLCDSNPIKSRNEEYQIVVGKVLS